jgi:Uncharacterized conserved protein
MEIQTTADGSSTIYIPELDEHYHSVNGAVQESRHVFLEAGFNLCEKKSIRVLELGFGTGLNALLTAIEAERKKVKVHYVTLEKFPLRDEILTQLNYSALDEVLFRKIHQTEWGINIAISDYFSIRKVKVDFSDYSFPDRYDVVYYDAFAPDKQKDVWTQVLFDRIAKQMEPQAILTTYCAKGSIRRMMQSAGLIVERIPGPPGKREMLRARCAIAERNNKAIR